MIRPTVTRAARRLGAAALTLVLASIVTFAIASRAPGRAADEWRLDPGISREAIDARAARAGAHESWWRRYAAWLGGVVTGDLGRSASYEQPVAALLVERVWNTARLAVPAWGTMWLLALPLGLWSAARAGTRGDDAFIAISGAIHALPDVVVGLLLLGAAVSTRLVAAGGMTAPSRLDPTWGGAARDALWHLAGPLLTLTLIGVPVLARHVRAAALEAIAAPCIGAARARGVSTRRAFARHVLRLTAPTLVPLAGLSASALLSGTLVVEVLFSWPGLGALLFQATASRDVVLVAGIVMTTATLLVAASAAIDIAVSAIDPRTGGR